METNRFGRRDFIKYGLISSLFVLSGCSVSKNKLTLRGFSSSFPKELISSLSSSWEFYPIKDIKFSKFTYNSFLQENTDLLVINDGWISNLNVDLLKEINAPNIRNNLGKQARSFLVGLGEEYSKRIFPLAVSPWVLLIRNEESLDLKNKSSWEVLLSRALENEVVLPKSPYLLISIAQKIGLLNDLSKLKRQAKTFDDRNALNWVVSGRASAAVLPLSRCIDSLINDPRLSVLLPEDGTPLNWSVLVSPSLSSEPFPTDWADLFFEKNSLKRIIRKGFLPSINFSYLSKKDINVSEKYQSILLPDESVWNKCWSLPLLSFEEKKDLTLKWNNS
tara:strand:- start:260 stop:1261 length:1002 start_codon:yes stop_codon:yes gene_type:complete